jgi:tetratricopeptide (TPR) repeat protein
MAGMRPSRSWCLLLLVLAGGGASLFARERAKGDGSLESYLEKLRKERDTELERLRPAVEASAKKLGSARSGAERKKLQQELEAFGPEAAPILLTYLDPGPQGGEAEERCALEVAQLFARTRPAGIVDELARRARSGTNKGRANALTALGSVSEGPRAVAHLRTLHGELAGALRGACVRSLSLLAPGDPLLVASLSDTHPAVVSAALVALRDEPRKAPRAEVLTVLTDPNRGADVLEELVAYLTVPGQTIDEDSAATLLRFAGRADLKPEVRLVVLAGIPRLGVPLNPKLKREFEPLTATNDAAIKDAALVALTLLKDSKARRELVKLYDDQVKDNDGWPLAYQRRGKIFLRIQEYGPAAKDFARALELMEESARMPANRELWIDLARAYVLDDKLAKAADVLQGPDFVLTTELRRDLAADPDFKALVESTKYRKLFE